jgi:L-fuconolactonase
MRQGLAALLGVTTLPGYDGAASFPDAEAAHEPVLEPDLPIVDAHHHLWFRSKTLLASLARSRNLSSRALMPTLRRHARYLFEEYLADVQTGHNVRASVFVDSHLMYRTSGPEAFRSVGEVEFVNGVAAASASGNFGALRACAGIVGGADLTMGSAVREVLEAHIHAGDGRYRGVRSPASYDPDATILGGAGHPHILLDSQFREGFRCLQQLGLSFDAFILEPQLPDLIDLASAFPDTRVVLNHLGTPMGIGQYAGQRQQRFPIWRDNMRALANCPNVSVKLGGIGMHFAGFGYTYSKGVSSQRLADDWKPYIESCIETFGVSRCMFESDYPVDSATCGYPVLWNAFKRITAGASKDEKSALYSGTAAQVYRIDLS